MTLSVINNEQDFFKLEKEWEELEKHANNLTVFQTWIFQYYTWRIFADRVNLHIILVRDKDGRLVGCAPLGTRIQKAGAVKLKILSFCCIKYCDFQNFIVHADYEEQVFSALAGWFKDNRRQWDVIEFKLLRGDFTIIDKKSHFIEKLRDSIKVENIGQAPYITIQDDWRNFQNALSSKRAKSVRYEVKNLFRQFEGEYKGFHKGDELENALIQMMDLHQKRIRQKHQLGAFATEHVRKGFLRLVRELEKKGYIAIHTIASEKRTVAAIGTFIHNKKVLYFQGGFDPEYFRLSPGKVVLAMRITEAIEDNAQEFDFLFGDEDYKFAWSTGQRQIFQLEITTGSPKRLIYKLNQGIQNRLLQSERIRALYFRLRPGS
ncbi:GNAT family N-acetyltransferase [candidate division KSB1 bacterium]|nr:GNAT family N-acetyltransferase [candidate division KSB1 bacterium]